MRTQVCLAHHKAFKSNLSDYMMKLSSVREGRTENNGKGDSANKRERYLRVFSRQQQ